MASGPSRPVRQPVIIMGAPRSGTTLLADLLEAHPDVAVVSEPRLVWRNGNDRRSDELRPEHATPEVVDHIHRHFHTVLRQRGASRLVEKTPANAVRPRFVDAVFPDATYVHIVRDGWGAVPSMHSFWQRRAQGFDGRQLRKLRRRIREAGPAQLVFYAGELLRRSSPLPVGHHVPLYGPRLAGLQQSADELGRLEAAALQWRACVEQTTTFGRALPPGRYLEVHLESLDPDALAAILAFCGLRPSTVVLELFDERYRPEAARHQAPLSPEEVELVAPYVLAANAWLGYPERPAGVVAGTGSESR